MPTYHNPTARTMDEEQRAKLLGLAARYRVPIIEDDVYSRTRLQGASPASLYRMDKHNVVIYLSTFSKVLAPGLRLGWIAAPPHMVKQLSLIKMRANFSSEELEFSVPQGGLYIWCRWRRAVDMEAVLLRAQEKGVSVAPGRAFFAGAADEHCFRICFTASSERDLPEAIRLLAEAFRSGE